jgi:hypothetical protein
MVNGTIFRVTGGFLEQLLESLEAIEKPKKGS